MRHAESAARQPSVVHRTSAVRAPSRVDATRPRHIPRSISRAAWSCTTSGLRGQVGVRTTARSAETDSTAAWNPSLPSVRQIRSNAAGGCVTGRTAPARASSRPNAMPISRRRALRRGRRRWADQPGRARTTVSRADPGRQRRPNGSSGLSAIPLIIESHRPSTQRRKRR